MCHVYVSVNVTVSVCVPYTQTHRPCLFSPVSLRIAGAELYQVALMVKGDRRTCCSRPALKHSTCKIKRLFGGPPVQVLTRFLSNLVICQGCFFVSVLSFPSSLLHPLALTPPCVDPNKLPCALHSTNIQTFRWLVLPHTKHRPVICTVSLTFPFCFLLP